ncbi:Ketopantoate reductase-like protein [Mycena indigotica]|uniref:Ketopantoate reductase-like protein n=1 Tax=Mycena indigotica TaxID=2126181 RepID=A0A8H6SZA9_9AGAR|nr:Ketopantoate reductase-like protein [Mycena indigotica]KAF7307047.1 Ketopantoate reductase-like protein [Mycena indigotica]
MANSCADGSFTESNPDIAGIGVRSSFYAQAFLLVILVDRSWQDAPIALWTFIATSFGLTVATIVQYTSRPQLTLFQALQVSNLVWLANFGTFVALASYSRQKAESRKQSHLFNYNVKFGACAQTLLSMALTLFMWAKVDTFGAMPECSHLVNYMVFAFKAPALGSGRIIGLTASSLLAAAYISVTFHELRLYHKKKRNSNDAETVTPPSPLPTNSPLPRALTFASSTSRRVSNDDVLPRTSRRRPRRRRWSHASQIDPMLIGILLCQMAVFIYFVVSSELLLSYNAGASTSVRQWGFGQILALIVVLPSALSVVGAFKAHGLGRLSKRKKIRVSRRSKHADRTRSSKTV